MELGDQEYPDCEGLNVTVVTGPQPELDQYPPEPLVTCPLPLATGLDQE